MPLGAIYSILRVSWCQLVSVGVSGCQLVSAEIYRYFRLRAFGSPLRPGERQWQFENDLMGPFIHIRVNLSAPVVWLFITRNSQ